MDAVTGRNLAHVGHAPGAIRSPYEAAAAAPQDTVSTSSFAPGAADLAAAGAGDAARLSKWQRYLLIGGAGVAIFGAGIGVGYVLHGVPTATTPPSQSVPAPPPVTPVPPRIVASPTDQKLLKVLDTGSQLFVDGQPVDGFGALRQLQSGHPVQVGIPRMGYHPSAYVDDPQGQLTADQVRSQKDPVVQPQLVTVTDFNQLDRLNAAEHLTDVDTSSSLTAAESSLVAQLSPFEGGVTPSEATKQIAQNGFTWSYRSDLPSPGLMRHQHSSSFKSSERLSAYEAIQELRQGHPIQVVSPSGLEQGVSATSDISLMSKIETPKPTDGLNLRTSPEFDVQAGLLRELSTARKLVSPDHSLFGQPPALSGFQAYQMLAQGKPVVVQIANGVTARITSLKDLEQLNAEEGLSKIDTSSLLSARDQQTAKELQTFEGRGDASALLALEKSWIHHGMVPGSTRLNVRDAAAAVNAGRQIAVKTPRGQVHVISSVEELDALWGMQPPPPAPAPAPAPPAAQASQPST